MKSGIYLIKNIINNKEYIGKSKNLQSRRYEHWRLLRKNQHSNPHLQKSYNKYGESSFVFIVVEYCNVSDLVRRETWWIELLETNNDTKGYNICSPHNGRLGMNHSEETKSRISQAHKQKHLPSIERLCPTCNITFQVHRCFESKRKGIYCSRQCYTVSRIGKKLSNVTRDKMVSSHSKTWFITNPRGEKQSITNLKLFCEANTLNAASLVDVAAGKRTHYKGWKVTKDNSN